MVYGSWPCRERSRLQFPHTACGRERCSAGKTVTEPQHWVSITLWGGYTPLNVYWNTAPPKNWYKQTFLGNKCVFCILCVFLLFCYYISLLFYSNLWSSNICSWQETQKRKTERRWPFRLCSHSGFWCVYCHIMHQNTYHKCPFTPPAQPE